MFVYTFKVQVSLNQNVLGMFFYRQSTNHIDGSLKTFRDNLIQRYQVFDEETPTTVTWIDNDGDIIPILNDDDLHTFMKLKREKVLVNVDHLKLISPEVNCITNTVRATTTLCDGPELLFENACDVHHPDKQLAAIRGLRKLISSDNIDDPNKPIRNGVLPILMSCLLRDDHSMLQLEAAWAITNIAAGTSKQTNELVAAGTVPLLLQLLTSPDLMVVEQAVWALGNIIGDSKQLRDYMIELQVVQPLLKLIKADSPSSLLKEAAHAIRNLCRSDVAPPTQTILDILPALNNLIQHMDVCILEQAALALHNLAWHGSDETRMIIDSGVIPKLIKLLAHGEVKVQTAVVGAVTNVTFHTDHLEVIMNCDVMSYLPSLLSHPNDIIRVRTLKVLQNITAGTQLQIQAVIDAELLPIIIENMRTGDFLTQTITVSIIGNVASKTENQINEVVRAGAVPILLQLLTSSVRSASHETVQKLNISTSLLKEVAYAVTNICWHKDTFPTQIMSDILSALNILIQHKDVYILEKVAWALSSLAWYGNEKVQMIIDSGVVPKLVPLLAHGQVKVQRAVCYAVVTIIHGSNERMRMQVFLNCNALSYLPILLSHPEKEIQECAIRLLKQITSSTGTLLQIKTVIDAGLLPKMIDNMRLRTGQTWALASRAVSYIRYIEFIVQQSSKDDFTTVFNNGSKCKDLRYIKVVLDDINNWLKFDGPYVELIKNVFKECGDVAKVEEFQKFMLLGKSLADEIQEICRFSNSAD